MVQLAAGNYRLEATESGALCSRGNRAAAPIILVDHTERRWPASRRGLTVIIGDPRKYLEGPLYRLSPCDRQHRRPPDVSAPMRKLWRIASATYRLVW